MTGFPSLEPGPRSAEGGEPPRAAHGGDFGLSVGFGGAAAAGPARALKANAGPALRCCLPAMSREDDFSS